MLRDNLDKIGQVCACRVHEVHQKNLLLKQLHHDIRCMPCLAFNGCSNVQMGAAGHKGEAAAAHSHITNAAEQNASC